MRHSGVVLVSALVLFVAVLFAIRSSRYLRSLGDFFAASIRVSRHAEGLGALRPTVFGIAGLLAFVLLMGAFRFLDLMLRRLRRAAPTGAPPIESTEQSFEKLVRDPTETSNDTSKSTVSSHRRPTAPVDLHTDALSQHSREHFADVRRRSGEPRIGPEYAGPYRRATDSVPGEPTPPPPDASQIADVITSTSNRPD